MLHIPCCRKTILCTHPILVGYFGYFIHIHTVLVASFIPFLLSHLSHSTHFRSSPWPEAPRPKARPERQPVPRSLAPLTLASSAVISAGWPGRNCLKAWEQAWSVSQILTKWPELLNWIQTKHDKAVWRLKISLNWPWHQAIPSQIDACLNTPGSVQVCCSQICSYNCSLKKLNDCDWLCALSQQCYCACRFNADQSAIICLVVTNSQKTDSFRWRNGPLNGWNAQMTWHRGNNRKRSVHNSRPVRSRRWKKSRTSWEARSKGQSKAMWSRSHLVALVSARNHSKSSKMQHFPIRNPKKDQRSDFCEETMGKKENSLKCTYLHLCERQTQAGTRFDHGCLVMWLLPQQALQSLAIRRSHGVFPSGCQTVTLAGLNDKSTDQVSCCLASTTIPYFPWLSQISTESHHGGIPGYRISNPKIIVVDDICWWHIPVNIPVLLIIVPSFFPGIRYNIPLLGRHRQLSKCRLATWLSEWEGEAFGNQETNFWRQRMIVVPRRRLYL